MRKKCVDFFFHMLNFFLTIIFFSLHIVKNIVIKEKNAK